MPGPRAVQERGCPAGIEIARANQAVAVDGGSATVGGIGVSGAFGVLNFGFKREKRDGSWIVTYQSQE